MRRSSQFMPWLLSRSPLCLQYCSYRLRYPCTKAAIAALSCSSESFDRGTTNVAALLLADGLLACEPHRADGSRHRGTIPFGANLDQEGAGRRQRLPGGVAEG